MAESISSQLNVKSIFVWQPSFTYKYDLKFDLFSPDKDFSASRSAVGYKTMKKWVSKTPPSNNFIWCADIQIGVKKPLYVDIVHGGPELAKMTAECIWSGFKKVGLVHR